MTDLKKAAQQALEALEKYATHGPLPGRCPVREAEYALKAALERQEQEPVAWTDRELQLIDGLIEVQLHHAAQCDGIANRTMAEKQKGWDMERVTLLRKIKSISPRRETEREQEQEQEPVARVLQTVGQYHTGLFVAEVETVRRLRNGESLYTAPPRREWQGLTEEEREQATGWSVEHIEAALKEKNNA